MPRSLLDWEWFDEPNTLKLYLILLFMAQWRDKTYNGTEIKRGQLVTTTVKLSNQSGLSVQQTKTVLQRLKSTNKITIKATNKFSIITLNEYDSDLESNQQINQQITNTQPTTQPTNNQPTLLKEEIKELRTEEHAHTRGETVVEKKSDNTVKEAQAENFERFWRSYPRKTAKQDALKAWLRIKPDEELAQRILFSLEQNKKSEQWQRDNGRYIPYPATWLNGRRWEDEEWSVPQTAQTKNSNYNTSSPPPNNQQRRYSSIDTQAFVRAVRERYRRGGSGQETF